MGIIYKNCKDQCSQLFCVAGSATECCPVVSGDAMKTKEFSTRLWAQPLVPSTSSSLNCLTMLPKPFPHPIAHLKARECKKACAHGFASVRILLSMKFAVKQHDLTYARTFSAAEISKILTKSRLTKRSNRDFQISPKSSRKGNKSEHRKIKLFQCTVNLRQLHLRSELKNNFPHGESEHLFQSAQFCFDSQVCVCLPVYCTARIGPSHLGNNATVTDSPSRTDGEFSVRKVCHDSQPVPSVPMLYKGVVLLAFATYRIGWTRRRHDLSGGCVCVQPPCMMFNPPLSPLSYVSEGKLFVLTVSPTMT